MDEFELRDIVVVGGGINGAGIARDAAGRGLRVSLCEMKDFASATSSASTKLIHGGLRYLEHYEFALVRKALVEREVLLASAPHIINPLRFLLPHHRALRPALLLRLGLFLYDHLGGRKILPPARKVRLKHDATGVPLKSDFWLGFEYSDCWVDDARLVLLNVMDAADRGAEILKGWRCTAAERNAGRWRVVLKNAAGAERVIWAKALVNASGSWAADLANEFEDCGSKGHRLRLVKGSHIIVPKQYDGDHAYTFQEADGRIIFLIPYEGDFTLIGTTDVSFKGDPAQVEISDDEIAYLCRVTSKYLAKPLSVDQVVWHYSGVRPLVDDGKEEASQITRDFILDLNGKGGEAPLLSVFGGKITTFRVLAEQALRQLAPYFPASGPAWTEGALLPGGNIGGLYRDAYLGQLQSCYPWAEQSMLKRYVRQYGSLAVKILDGCKTEADLGQHFGHNLYEAELRYLITHEWATCSEDILWRRTKLGLFLTDAGKDALANWLATHLRAAPVSGLQ